MPRNLLIAALLLLASPLFAQSLQVPNQSGTINAGGQTFAINYAPGADSGGLDFTLGASPAANLTLTAVSSSIPNGTSSCTVTAASVTCLIQAVSPAFDLGAGAITVTYTAAGNAGPIALSFSSAEFSDQNGDPEPGTTAGGTLNLPKGNQATLSASATPSSLLFAGSSTLGSSGGSGSGAVTYAVTAGASVCALSGGTLTAIGVGSCTVTATKAGDANYNATTASLVIGVSKANQAALSATATPATIIIGNSSVLATSGGSGGGSVSYTIATGGTVCAISSSTLTGIGIGSCTVTATRAADANYNAATATTSVTVNNVPTSQSLAVPNQSGAIHVTAQSFAINYTPGSDSGAFNFTLTASPGANLTVNSVAASIPNGVPSCSSTASAVSCSVSASAPAINLGAGTITVAYTGGAVAGAIALNFNSASFFGQAGGSGPGVTTNGTLTLVKANQATLSAIAAPSSIVFGGSSALSIAGGSGAGALSYAVTSGTSVCAISGSTLSAIGVGSCTVTATKAGDADFNPATATTSVAVGKANQAALSATASPSTIFFGGSSSLSASGGSGSGALSYAVTSGGSVCSISGSTLTGSGIGGCSVTATRAADTNYNAATATVGVTVNSLPSAQSLAVPSQTGAINTTGQTVVINYTPGADSAAFDFSLAATPATNLSITAVSASIPNGSTSCSHTASTVTCLSTAGNPSLDLGAGSIAVTYNSGPIAGVIALGFTAANFIAQTGNSEPGTTTNGTLTLPKIDQAAFAVLATPASIVFGGTTALTTTGGSGTGAVGLAVTSGSTLCSISGSTLTANGVGTCTVTATKAGDASYTPATASTVVTVGKANQAPLSVLASPSSIAFGASSAISASGGSGTGALSYALTSGGSVCTLVGNIATAIGVGSCVVTVTRAADANFSPASAAVSVTAVNSAPSVSAAASLGTLEDLASSLLAITLSDTETQAAALILAASSSNQAIVTDASLAAGLGGSGASRSLLVTPVANANGNLSVTLTVTDAHGGSSSRVLAVSVAAVNDAPTFTIQGNVTTAPGANGAQSRPGLVSAVTLGPPDEQSNQAVQAYAVSELSDPAGVVGAIALTNNGTLSFSVSGVSGIASFSAALTDNGGTANGGVATSQLLMFTITVPLATDLEISLGNGVAHFLSGASTRYEIIAANAGPTAVSGARVLYQLPAGLSNATWTCTPVLLASCPAAIGSGGIDQSVELQVGGALRYTLDATVSAPLGAMIAGTASIAVPAGFIDLDTLDNTVSDNDPVVPELILSDDFESASAISVPLSGSTTRD